MVEQASLLHKADHRPWIVQPTFTSPNPPPIVIFSSSYNINERKKKKEKLKVVFFTEFTLTRHGLDSSLDYVKVRF